MSNLISADEAAVLTKIFEIAHKYKECSVKVEESHKGYISFKFTFDFMVDVFTSFVIFDMEGNSTGAESNNFKEILEKLEKIDDKAHAVKER